MYTLTLRGESSGPLMFLSCWWGFWPTWAKKSESIVMISVSSLAASKCDSLYFRIDKPTWNKTYTITVILIQIMNDSPIKIWTIPFKLETINQIMSHYPFKLWATIHSNFTFDPSMKKQSMILMTSIWLRTVMYRVRNQFTLNIVSICIFMRCSCNWGRCCLHSLENTSNGGGGGGGGGEGEEEEERGRRRRRGKVLKLWNYMYFQQEYIQTSNEVNEQ